MDDKLEFAQRLHDAMQRAGYKPRPAVLEREFNTRYWGESVTVQAVRRWLRGEAIPSQDKLQTLAEWLKVEPQILRFGEGIAKSVKQYRERWDEKLTHQERETVDAFLQLPAPQRKVVREVILTFAKVYKDDGGTPSS
ncbi:helix-turn-helix domain-containing protein [Sphaerotilus sp.]|uniref:helix-turn-helix domain-containing protein n=1 Tax=Sphaerotilus sp. TaxID=2093942 RepID=UPI00286D6C48|nr:helix-turn-helix domain-containing protein [Sphaerotilus sp.]